MYEIVWFAPAVMSASVAEPSNVTVVEATTSFWSEPAFTTGTRLAFTKIDTSSVPSPVPSAAVRRNTNVWSALVDGTRKVFVVDDAPSSVTVSPETWVQVYEIVWFAPAVMSASVAEPSRVTTVAAATSFWSLPAFTTGTRLAFTKIETVSLAVPP